MSNRALNGVSTSVSTRSPAWMTCPMKVARMDRTKYPPFFKKQESF
jgi:hypothetical protein